MGCRALLRAWFTATLVSLVCLASEGPHELDPDISQKEITFDHVMMREILNSESDVMDWEEIKYNPPRINKGSILESRISFPPARPVLENLPALCHYINNRPRYPPDSLPQSGFGYLVRQAKAINRVEAWYDGCCQGNETQERALTLCCAQQAWERSLSDFCDEEFTIKTSHYHCCKKYGNARWKCFEKTAPNPTYVAQDQSLVNAPSPQEPGFTWNRSSCQRMAPRSLRGEKQDYKVPHIDFPPGRPSSSNIQSVCGLQKLRPLHLLKCLPSSGYGWLAHRFKVMNKMEKEIHKCCKRRRAALTCVDKKWQDMMDWFCKEEHSVKTHHFPCCQFKEREKRYACFSSHAPNPQYMVWQKPIDMELPVLSRVCDTHELIVKRFPVPFPIESIVSECCHLPASRTTCVENRLSLLLNRTCTAEETLSSDLSPNCCLEAPSQSTPNCLATLLEEAIEKAIKSPYYRRRKCPTP